MKQESFFTLPKIQYGKYRLIDSDVGYMRDTSKECALIFADTENRGSEYIPYVIKPFIYENGTNVELFRKVLNEDLNRFFSMKKKITISAAHTIIKNLVYTASLQTSSLIALKENKLPNYRVTDKVELEEHITKASNKQKLLFDWAVSIDALSDLDKQSVEYILKRSEA